MSVTAEVLFGRPQAEIASLLRSRMSRALETHIVTGFATPGGLSAIAPEIEARPKSLKSLVVGAATYPGFQALDQLAAARVPPQNLYVHLGHTRRVTSGFARYHPMLHSKVYYMELPGSQACAFIGSHNITSFALTGLNGEAGVLLDGDSSSKEFHDIRVHLQTARSQATQYDPAMKDAYAWWTHQFIEGLKSEIALPTDPIASRTILVFAECAKGTRPLHGDQIYFEIPAGIQRISTLQSQTHVFLFENGLSRDPRRALANASASSYRFLCKTLGVENQQGNIEIEADWRISQDPRATLHRVTNRNFRPNTAWGKQQVRVQVDLTKPLPSYEYLFEIEKRSWEPVLSDDYILRGEPEGSVGRRPRADSALMETPAVGWRLVTGLIQREARALQSDEAALRLAAPDSGAFVLVSLMRQKLEPPADDED